MVAGKAGDLKEGAALATQSIDNGKAAARARHPAKDLRMSDTLDKIVAGKRQPRRRPHGAAARSGMVEALARDTDSPRGFAKALKATIAAGRYGLIAEIKKASPSKGLIRAGLRPACPRPCLRARRRHVPVGPDRRALLPGQGRVPDARPRAAARLPVLRKDFMIDPYQVVEARALGADCILLDHGLPRRQAGRRAGQARAQMGHGRAGRGARRPPSSNGRFRSIAILIGVNNRNLKTLAVDLATTEQLAPMVPKDRVLVAESGLGSPADLRAWPRSAPRPS